MFGGFNIRRLLFMLFLLVFIAGAVNARNLEKHGLLVLIDSQGLASIKEKYYYAFENDAELEAFKQTVKQNGPSFVAWKVFDASIFPHIIGSEDELLQKSVLFNEEQGFLEINYSLSSKIVMLDEQSRTTVFSLIQNRFNYFIQGASVIIPKNTSITISIPENALVLQALPVPSKQNHEISWNGFLSSNQLALVYEIRKPIAPTISLSDLVEGIFSKSENVFILVIIAVIIIFLYWKKDAVSEKIEGYVVKHSEIRPEAVEEEIQIKS